MYPTLSLTEKGNQSLELMNVDENFELQMDEPEIEIEIESPKIKTSRKMKLKSNLDYDQDLFEKFRVLRKSLSIENKIPPYVIASDKTLIELAHYLPKNSTQLLNINGFGEVKVKRYGNAFLELIQE